MLQIFPKIEVKVDEARHARDSLLRRLVDAYENPHCVEGILALFITDAPSLSCWISFLADRCEIFYEKPDQIDAALCWTKSALLYVFANREVVDWRYTEIAKCMEAVGQVNLVTHFAQGILSPHPKSLEIYIEAERKCFSKGYRFANSVERLVDASLELVLTKIISSFPVVFENGADKSRGQIWTKKRFLTYFSDAVLTDITPQGNGNTLASLLDYMDGTNFSGQTSPPLRMPPGLEMPLEMSGAFAPQFFQQEDYFSAQLLISGRFGPCSSVGLHRIPNTNFVQQVVGQLQVDLYSPDQAIYLYPIHAHNSYQPCWYMPHMPDFTLFPKAADAAKLSVLLEPSQTLMVPAGWFQRMHEVDDLSISVGYAWRHRPSP